MADKVTGLHAAYAITMALIQRAQTGVGQKVHVPMFETMSAFNLIEHQWGHAFEPPIAPMGYEPVSTASRRPYRTKDGLQMSGASTSITRLPPQLGEHTREILLECGFAPERVRRWLAEGGPCHPART